MQTISITAVAVRIIVSATGWAAMLLAVPAAVLGYAPVAVVAVTGLFATAAAGVPRRHAALVLELGVVGIWLLPGRHYGPSAAVSLAVAALLYVHHAGAALAVATGWDARATRSLARSWSARTAVIVAGASVISAVMLLLTGRPVSALPDEIVLAGLLAAVLAVAVPLARLRRPPRASDPSRAALEQHQVLTDD